MDDTADRVDVLKQVAIDAYRRRDLPAALAAFKLASVSSPARPDIAAKLSATLFELGMYGQAAIASASALALAAAAGDTRREAACTARRERAQVLAALSDAYAASRTRPGPEALPPLTRPKSVGAWAFFPIGHEVPISFLSDRAALAEQVDSARTISANTPLWLEAEDASAAQSGDFSVMLAASSDPRHVFASLDHLSRLARIPEGSEPRAHKLRVHTNDITAQVIARQVLLFALLLEAEVERAEDCQWDFCIPPAIADACNFERDVLYFGMAYAFLAAHNFSRVQWALFTAALERNIAAAETAETWDAKYGGHLSMDDDTRAAVRGEWQRWREELKLSAVNRKWGGDYVCGAMPVGYDPADPASAGSGFEDGPLARLAAMGVPEEKIAEFRNRSKPEAPHWLDPEKKLAMIKSAGGHVASKAGLADRIVEMLGRALSECAEDESYDAKVVALAKALGEGEDSDYAAWTEAEMHALYLEHVPGSWIAERPEEAFSHIPRIRAEAEFYERTGCVLPPKNVESFPHSLATATEEELDGMFVFNPSFRAPVRPGVRVGAEIEKTSLDPFAFSAGEIIDDCADGTIAWICVNRLISLSRTLGETMLGHDGLRTGVALILSFSVADMFEVMARTAPASIDRILVSNVPDYSGWASVFILAVPLLKRSPQSVLTGDCLRNPPLFPSFELLFEATPLVPWSWTAARHGINLMWGSDPSTDTVAIGTSPGAGASGSLNVDEALNQLSRILARSLYIKSPQNVGGGPALEIVSSTTSALALWALVARNEIPLHTVRQWLAGVVESGKVALDCAKPRLRVEPAHAFSPTSKCGAVVAPILADFAYAVYTMFGAANPCAGVLPTAFVTLKLREGATTGCGLLPWGWGSAVTEDPALQVCLLLSVGGQTVGRKAEQLLVDGGLAQSVKKGVDAATGVADVEFHVWSVAFRVDWTRTQPGFGGRVDLELDVPTEFGQKVRDVDASARWFGLGAVDHGHLRQLELI